jgi:hypothetical protein
MQKMSKEISEEKILGSKFTLSLQTMIAAGTGLASLIGMWYALQADIQEAITGVQAMNNTSNKLEIFRTHKTRFMIWLRK